MYDLRFLFLEHHHLSLVLYLQNQVILLLLQRPGERFKALQLLDRAPVLLDLPLAFLVHFDQVIRVDVLFFQPLLILVQAETVVVNLPFLLFNLIHQFLLLQLVLFQGRPSRLLLLR